MFFLNFFYQRLLQKLHSLGFYTKKNSVHKKTLDYTENCVIQKDRYAKNKIVSSPTVFFYTSLHLVYGVRFNKITLQCIMTYFSCSTKNL
jgi:hypothetical protein